MMTRRHLLAAFAQPPDARLGLPRPANGDPPLEAFFAAAGTDHGSANLALRLIEQTWRPPLASMLLDFLHLPLPPDHPTRRRLTAFLEKLTRQNFGADLPQWLQWCWKLAYEPHPQLGEFKGLVYGNNIDARMRDFFPPGVQSRIRLDQVQWGGVVVNGIPPLVDPLHVAAAEAGYLKDHHVVFGIAWNGEARAYPKRILAWHEMARDHVGGLDLAIVYCTLCGTVIPYRAQTPDRRVTLGTSGLLYESSKLMFDEETKSLWPTLEGRPAIGPLWNSPMQLELAPVVTTTWGEWRQQYPATQVLSLETGHRRDYGEGAAYRDYFATDQLMFSVSRLDRRLKRKDEVLVIRLPGRTPLAISARLLAARRRFAYTHEGFALVVVTSAQGANRVYAAGDGHQQLPAHRAFWFGWYAQFPATTLLQ